MGAGQERSGEVVPTGVPQVNDRERQALGGQLLADGLNRRGAVGHHQDLQVHAAVRADVRRDRRMNDGARRARTRCGARRRRPTRVVGDGERGSHGHNGKVDNGNGEYGGDGTPSGPVPHALYASMGDCSPVVLTSLTLE
jgi:hypothetical protein